MDCKSHSREGRHQQESVSVMPELCTAVPGSAVAASSTPNPLKSTGQLLKTLGVGSSMCSFLPTGGTARALNHSQRHEGSSRDIKNSHTDSLHPAVSKKPSLCHSESDFCFVEACDEGGDLTSGKSWLPVSSGRSAKSNFVNKVVGAFRNISQRSTTWINPDYLVAATSKSSHLGRNLLPPQGQHKNFNLMESQVGVGCEVDSRSFLPPKGNPNWHPASCGTVDYSCSGSAAAPQPAWQNSDVLGSQSDEFLFWDMSHAQFLLEQQQQYLYYEKLQNRKSPSTCSDNSYGSGLDDSWNVVSARDCGQTNYSGSVNGNTAPPGVFNGLMQFAVPSISCVNVTTASQLFSSGMSQRIPSPSFSTLYSTGISEFYRGAFQNEENYQTATHEFLINEAPETEVDDGQVTSRNFSPYFGCLTVTPEASEIAAASDPQNFLTINQSNNLTSVKSSLNPNAKEWNGWVSCSKLNPEAKEWVPQTVENVQSPEISTHQSDLVYVNENEKTEEEEKQFDKETFSLLAELEIENVDSGLGKCAEDSINVDTMSDQSTESSCPAISTSDEDVHSSCHESDTCESVYESGMCFPETLKHDAVPKKSLENLSESSESSSLSWDSVETCDSPKLNERELPELSLSCNKVNSKSSDEAILKNGENAESRHRSGASPKKSSCTLVEKLRNFSFTPCEENNQDEEYDDACEFIIFAEGDCEDPGESAENDPFADDYTSDESDVSDGDSESENEDISLDSDESFDAIEVSSADDCVQVYVTPPSPEPSQINCCSLPKCPSVSPFWRDKQQQQQEQGAYADLSDDDWDWHSESKSGSISATCWAFEQGLMTLKTPINTLSKRLGYVEKERKKSLTEVEKANLKWDTEIDDNVLGNSGQKVQFDDEVSFYFVEKDIERKGEWEQIARDNGRFRNRIQNLSAILSPVLENSHRNAVYQARFSRSSREEEVSARDR